MPAMPAEVISGDMNDLPIHSMENKSILKDRQGVKDKMKARDVKQGIAPDPKMDEKFKKQFAAQEKLKEVTISVEDENLFKNAEIRKITKYLKAFPQKLDGLKLPRDLSRKSLSELKELRKLVEHELGSSAPIDLLGLGYIALMKKAEEQKSSLEFLGMNLSGLGRVAETTFTDTMRPLFEEFVIKYDEYFTSKVEVRIVQATISVFLQTHRLNMAGAQKFVETAVKTTSPSNLKSKINKL